MVAGQGLGYGVPVLQTEAPFVSEIFTGISGRALLWFFGKMLVHIEVHVPDSMNQLISQL